MHCRHREPIKLAGDTHRVGSHVLEHQPITDLQLGQKDVVVDLVNAVTRWTPYGRGCQLSSWNLLKMSYDLVIVALCIRSMELQKAQYLRGPGQHN
jgi:hypothetical protein